MSLSIRMLQSMVALNQNSIRRTEESIKYIYYCIKCYPESKEKNRKLIRKRKKEISKAVTIQKALKKELANAYWSVYLCTLTD